MRYTFVMDGEQIDLEAEYIRYGAKLEDITPVGALWKEIINSGDNRIELKGRTADGREVSGVFRILFIDAKNIPTIERWTDHPTVGGGD